MATDKQRYNQFQKDIRALQEELSFKAYYDTIQAKLLDILAKYELKDIDTLWRLRKIVEPAFHPEFRKYVDQIFITYNVVLETVNEYYDDLGVDISRDFDEIRALERVNRTKLGQYEDDEIKRIAKDLRKGIRKGWDHKRIAKQLRTGTGDRVRFYAQTIARTQVKGYSRMAKMEKARIGEVFWFEYVGIIREHTRDFCRNLLAPSDPTYHIDSIMQMNNNNLMPVRIYGGGWNCHHDWEPDPFYNEK